MPAKQKPSPVRLSLMLLAINASFLLVLPIQDEMPRIFGPKVN